MVFQFMMPTGSSPLVVPFVSIKQPILFSYIVLQTDCIVWLTVAVMTFLTIYFERASITRSPEQKVISVKKLRERYKNIIMVGDGINDAPALAEATVGIAMGAHGTAVSAESADMVLLVDDITRVSHAIKIDRRTVQIAKQSIYVGLGASFIFMVIASFGLIPPTVGALLQEVFDVAVILNALSAR